MKQTALRDMVEGCSLFAFLLFCLSVSPIVCGVLFVWFARSGIEQAMTPAFVQLLTVVVIVSFGLAGLAVGAGLTVIGMALARRPILPASPNATFKFDARGLPLPAPSGPEPARWSGEPAPHPFGQIPLEIEERDTLPALEG